MSNGKAQRPLLRFTAVRSYRIHSMQVGTGEPVVLLHGLSGSLRWWRYTIPALAETYEVHVPELVGFGRSRPGLRQFSIKELAEIVAEWMSAAGLARVRLIGHSMGGQISVHLATSAPQQLQRLVLADASGIPRPIAAGEATRLLAGLIPPRAWGAPLFLPRIALDALRSGPRTLLQAARGLLADDIRPLLPRVATPTLVIWGARDPLTPLAHGQAIAQAIPQARLIVLERAAHNVMVDRPAEFNQAVQSFFAA